MTEYALVKDLPQPVQAALSAVSYGRKDIPVEVSVTLNLSGGGGDGLQAFTTMVNLDNGEHKTVRGSWGGANMFNPSNAVDNDRAEYALPPNGVVIKGHRGGVHPVSAILHIPAVMRQRVLPAAGVELSPVEKDTLAVYQGYKSAARPEYLRRARSTSAVVDGLVSRGLLSRNRAGATQITTAGKNAVGNHRFY